MWRLRLIHHSCILIVELPKPNLGDMDDFKALSDCLRREKLPNLLGYKYDELCNFDLVKIALVPERKGLILKHVEYEVTSRVSADRRPPSRSKPRPYLTWNPRVLLAICCRQLLRGYNMQIACGKRMYAD